MRGNLTILLMLTCLASIVSLATTLGPCAGVCEVFEAIVEKAKAEPEVSGDALMLLALITEGRPVEIPEAVEARLGLPPIDLLSVPFTRPENRAEACRYIGKLATKDAVFYLELLSTGKFKGDDLYAIWPSCQVALVEARMLNLLTQDERVEFLLAELQAKHDDYSQAEVGWWVENALCDSGHIAALPAVASYIHTWQGRSERAEKAIDFCRQRMEVIASHPDRVQALASVLTLNATDENQKLYAWAYYSLIEMGSEEAFAAVDRFVEQANAVAAEHPSKRILYHHTVDIGSARSNRRPVKLQ